MRRLLTGYAIYFKRTHRRYGHLFQNRYKSILCQEDTYFLELVRYIHLNPLRSKIVKDVRSLDTYPYSGHSVLMGTMEHEWQDTEYVLKWFGKRLKAARARYRDFTEEGIPMGKRPDFIGGGLIRSVGGWSNLFKMRKAKVFVKGDERMLGESDFVEQILLTAGEAFEKRSSLVAQGWDMDKLAAHVAKLLDIEVSDVFSVGKYRQIVKARSLLCYWAVRELGIPMASLARRLTVSPASVTQSVVRGEKLVMDNHYPFLARV